MAASDALSVSSRHALRLPFRPEANTNFMQLQEELTNTENKISYARQFVQQCLSLTTM